MDESDSWLSKTLKQEPMPDGGRKLSVPGLRLRSPSTSHPAAGPMRASPTIASLGSLVNLQTRSARSQTVAPTSRASIARMVPFTTKEPDIPTKPRAMSHKSAIAAGPGAAAPEFPIGSPGGRRRRFVSAFKKRLSRAPAPVVQPAAVAGPVSKPKETVPVPVKLAKNPPAETTVAARVPVEGWGLIRHVYCESVWTDLGAESKGLRSGIRMSDASDSRANGGKQSEGNSAVGRLRSKLSGWKAEILSRHHVDSRAKPTRYVEFTGRKQSEVDGAVAWFRSKLSGWKADLRRVPLDGDGRLKPLEIQALKEGSSLSKLELALGCAVHWSEAALQTKSPGVFHGALQVVPQHDSSMRRGPDWSAKIEVLTQDIMNLTRREGSWMSTPFDAIVNAANSTLASHEGLAALIAKEGGQSLQDDCRRVLEQNGPISCGQAVVTSSGDLAHVAHVVHTVGPSDSDGEGTLQGRSPEQALHSCAFNSLEALFQVKGSPKSLKIALPAISTGLFSISSRVSAKGLIGGMLAWIAQHPDCRTEVVICLRPRGAESIVSDFVAQLHSAALPGGSLSAPVALPRPPPPPAHIVQYREQVQWYWKEDRQKCKEDRVWIPYDQAENYQIEVGRQAGQSVVGITGDRRRLKNGSRYTVRLVDGLPAQQVNEKTSYKRDVRCGCLCTAGSPTDREEPLSRAQLLATMHKASRALANSSAQQDKPYQAYAPPAVPRAQSQGRFSLTFFGSGEEAQMGAVAPPPTPRSLAPPQLTLECLASKLAVCLDAVRQHAAGLIKSTTVPVPKKDAIDLGELRNAHPKVEFALKQNSSGTTLVLRYLSEAERELANVTIRRQLAHSHQVKYPSDWSDSKSLQNLVAVGRDTPEFHDVLSRMQKTMPAVKIHRLERIQNRPLYRAFDAQKQLLADEKGQWPGIDRTRTERLFHGTRTTPPTAVYTGMNTSFDMRHSKDGMWGRANYFAVNASYSHTYRHRLDKPRGQAQMFLVTVLVGAHVQLAQDATLIKPPNHASLEKLVRMPVEYESVKGHTGGSDVFMIYANHRAYPSHLITYSA